MTSRLIALLALVLPAVALAEVESPNGIKIGEGRLHPYLLAEGHYDSAVGYFQTAPGVPLTQAGEIYFTLLGGLKFDLINPDTVVRFGGNGGYVFYTGLLTTGDQDASHFQAQVNLDAAFNKTGAVEFQIGDMLNRSDRPVNPLLAVGTISLYNSARVAVPIHPGGGALEFSPNAAWSVEFFEPLTPGVRPGCVPTDPTCNPGLLSSMNYSNINLGLGARWKFLPKTAIIFNGGVDLRSYFAGVGAPATLMQLQAGLAGLISTKLSLVITAGYGHDFAASGANTFLAQAELSLLLNDNFNFKFGYLRNLAPVPVFGTYGDDRGYLEAKFNYGRFAVVANGAFDYLSFYTNANRNDSVISASVTPQVQIFSWWTVGLGYRLSMRLTNAAGASFSRNEVILSLNFAY